MHVSKIDNPSMSNITKPILNSGLIIKDNVFIKNRIEKVFFTEIYALSNNKFFYLFTDLNPNDVIKKYDYELIKLNRNNREYLGIISDDNSPQQITEIIDKLTSAKGFDCVAGMNDLKRLLINDVINPLLHPEKFKKFKLSIPNGILLYGPPGCGKTFIVKKLADELKYTFIELQPSSVATPYVHGAVSNIGKVFELAKLKAPSIVFIDEIEGLLPKREELGSHADTKKEEINEFLIQLNNAGNNNILVVGATNRPHLIDSAIMRSGRMDKRIFVPPPDFEARKELFKICLSGRPFDKRIAFEKLAQITENLVCSDIELIVTQSARRAIAEDKPQIDEFMLIDIIGNFPPSITQKEIEYYNQFTNIERK